MVLASLMLMALAPQVVDLPMKVVNVVITSRKFDESIRFYGDVMGLKQFFHDKTSCFFRGGGVNVVIVRQTGEVQASQICLDFAVSDLAKASEMLTRRGAKLDSKTDDILTLHDPDGNLIEVVHG